MNKKQIGQTIQLTKVWGVVVWLKKGSSFITSQAEVKIPNTWNPGLNGYRGHHFTEVYYKACFDLMK